ncbi:hypothetical protein L873DRAFT_1832133 [Choiromyces venosus 120613-1]|uniref:Calmodulin n=1 Tax=Choiromyces venosus 120613-1 TaxID=1336337 RepID=A0A3N4IXN6_9PEZI|nr:hypothetical protein L873DRAFT_1832133 [Choiromyces venosus 120613-1]
MFSTGPNNPRQGTAPPADGHNRRAQGLQQSPPTAGVSNNPLGGGGTGHQHQQQQRERDRDHTPEQHRPQERGTIVELSEEHRAKINEAFHLFDLNKDRMIDCHELKVAMKTLGFDVPKPELLQILGEHGTRGPAQQAQPERDPLEEILSAFDLFANAAGGETAQVSKIAVEDLRRVARELGETLEEEELRAMTDEFDIIMNACFISCC